MEIEEIYKSISRLDYPLGVRGGTSFLKNVEELEEKYKDLLELLIYWFKIETVEHSVEWEWGVQKTIEKHTGLKWEDIISE